MHIHLIINHRILVNRVSSKKRDTRKYHIYVLSICIWRNRHKFLEANSFREFFSLLYSYETVDIDEDKEIILSIDENKKRVTPGVPMVTLAFYTSLALFLISYFL